MLVPANRAIPIEQTHEPLKPEADQRADLLRRALAAWFKTGGTEMPNESSGVKMHLGLAYVVLHGAAGARLKIRLTSAVT